MKMLYPFSDSEFTKLQIYYQDLFYEHVEQQRGYEVPHLCACLCYFAGLLKLSLLMLTVALHSL